MTKSFEPDVASYEPLLDRAHALARAYLGSLRDRRVGANVSADSLRASIAVPLPDGPTDAVTALEAMAAAAGDGLVASAGPRYFGFVTGGSFPVALAADWLVSAWDQNAAMHVMSPAVAAMEDAAAGWVLELCGLPSTASVGLTTGAHTANVVALATARHEVLRRAGWNVEAEGLQGAPRVHVVAGEEAHVSIAGASRLIGLGAATGRRAAADDQGRMIPDDLRQQLAHCPGPTIVCAQAGNVNTGAFDPFEAIADLTQAHGAWLHIDGAFGLWAAASPDHRRLLDGAARADSWTVDGHKWLNMPYDCGIVCMAHSAAHRASMSQSAAYLVQGDPGGRNGMDWVLEASRRARAVPLYVLLRSLGRQGVADLVARCCGLAARAADRLQRTAGAEILNEVVLNQVLARFRRADGANITEAVIARVQADGVCWVGGTAWHGEPAMRLSVSGWQTTEDDIDRSVDAIVGARAKALR